MARTTRNSFAASYNRKKVVVQTSIPVTDADQNEMQDILLREAIQGVRAQQTAIHAAHSMMHGELWAAGDDWRIAYDTGAGTFSAKAGVAYVDGMRIFTSLDQSLGITLLSVPSGGSPGSRYGYIYAQLVLVEQDAVDDPTIAVPNVGETCLRNTTSIAWANVESTVDYETALATLPVLTPYEELGLVSGYTSRVLIAKYEATYESGQVRVRLFDLRRAVASQGLEYIFGNRKSGPAGQSDPLIAWDAPNDRLTFGFADDSETRTGFEGFRLSTPGGMRHTIGKFMTPNWDVTPVAVGGGYTLQDGEALGYVSIPATATSDAINTRFLTSRGGYDYAAVPGVLDDVTSEPLANVIHYQLPVVKSIDLFVTASAAAGGAANLGTTSVSSRQGTFIVCAREGDDLMWWNGRATRGSSQQAVIDDPTNNPDRYTAVFAQDGTGAGTKKYALEMALALLTKSNAIGSVAGWDYPADNSENFGRRYLNFFLKKGKWEFSRFVRFAGKSAANGPPEWAYNYDDSTVETGYNMFDSLATMDGIYSGGDDDFEADCGISIEGAGRQLSAIMLREATNAQKTAALTNATLTICATNIKLKDLSVLTDVTEKLGYSLRLVGETVELEGCYFNCPVDIIGNAVIKNCWFDGKYVGLAGEMNTSNDYYLGSADSETPLAHMLRVRGGSAWVENCMFWSKLIKYAQCAVSLPNRRNVTFIGNTIKAVYTSLSPGGAPSSSVTPAYAGLVLGAADYASEVGSIIRIEGNNITTGYAPVAGTSSAAPYANSDGLPHLQVSGKTRVVMGCISSIYPLGAYEQKLIVRGNRFAGVDQAYTASVPWMQTLFWVWAGVAFHTSLLENVNIQDNDFVLPTNGVKADAAGGYKVVYGLHMCADRANTGTALTVKNLRITQNRIRGSWVGHAGGRTDTAPAKPALTEASWLVGVICRQLSDAGYAGRDWLIEGNSIELTNTGAVTSLAADTIAEYTPHLQAMNFDAGDRANTQSSVFQPTIYGQDNLDTDITNIDAGIQGLRIIGNSVRVRWSGISGDGLLAGSMAAAFTCCRVGGAYNGLIANNVFQMGKATPTAATNAGGAGENYAVFVQDCAAFLATGNVLRGTYGVVFAGFVAAHVKCGSNYFRRSTATGFVNVDILFTASNDNFAETT